MICSKCKSREASICDDCYKLEDTIKYKNASISQKIHPNSPHYCDFCGRTFDEISNTAYVGCEYCYKFFDNQLKDIIFNYHNVKGDISNER